MQNSAMEIVGHEEIGDKKWDAFCDASPQAWLRHTTRGRKGALALNPDNEDHSFGVMRGDTLVAVAPLVTQPLGEGEREFAQHQYASFRRTAYPHRCRQENLRGRVVHAGDRPLVKARIARTRMFIDP